MRTQITGSVTTEDVLNALGRYAKESNESDRQTAAHTPEVVYLGCDANEETLQKLADQFLSADQEIISSPLCTYKVGLEDVFRARFDSIESEKSQNSCGDDGFARAGAGHANP